MHYVYCIGEENDLVYPYSNCYIGVTNNLKKRFRGHLRSKYTVGKYIRNHHLTYEDNMRVIYFGDKQDCFDVEIEYRPSFYMGLNESPGGRGGDVSKSKTRGKKLSKIQKGKPKTPEHIAAMKRAKRGCHKGKSNPNSKERVLVSPDGKRIDVTGRFEKVCEENNLIWTVLHKHKGCVVPPIKTGTYGGFRAKNEEHMKMRQNTTGWALFEVSTKVGEV